MFSYLMKPREKMRSKERKVERQSLDHQSTKHREDEKQSRGSEGLSLRYHEKKKKIESVAKSESLRETERGTRQ